MRKNRWISSGISGRLTLLIVAFSFVLFSCGGRPSGQASSKGGSSSSSVADLPDEDVRIQPALLVSPRIPLPGQPFQVMVAGGKDILKAKVLVNGPDGSIQQLTTRSGNTLPYWQIVEFKAGSAGKYEVNLSPASSGKGKLSFTVTAKPDQSGSNGVWTTEKGWDATYETLYSAWVNALFCDADERSSWKAFHEVTQNQKGNFLYNHLALGEDDASSKVRVIMEPDCADCPFYMRAYFAWKVGLPFGYHECDRGSLGRPPGTGRWITNETAVSKAQPVQRFNTFLRMVMNGVHSGTARAAMSNENSDYYPVPLTTSALRPGVVYADPYGHTLILVGKVAQTDKPGVLLSVDAQPDGTVGIKRFWKGNFLFSTNEVIGDPGFKTFRPIRFENGRQRLLASEELTAASGWTPFSLQQKKLSDKIFYHTMERIINPRPLDPEVAMLDLIAALHEQLIVRVTSVANGEAYMKSHPGEVIPMPGKPAGVFQAGGQWEDFSTPNRDLRLLIAMDAILDFPDKLVRSPEDFKIPMLQSPEHVKKNLEALLAKKLDELSITYVRSNGSDQKLTMAQLLQRRDAFEMGYNPNDGAEIRWGAPENSEERSTCHRKVPANQLEKMQSVRPWFRKRLHPPT